jgi:hypothetical protein
MCSRIFTIMLEVIKIFINSLLYIKPLVSLVCSQKLLILSHTDCSNSVYHFTICFSWINFYIIVLSNLQLKPYVKYSLDISGLNFFVYFYSCSSSPPLYIRAGGAPPVIRTGHFKVTSIKHNRYIIVFGPYSSLQVLIISKCYLMKVSYTYARPFCKYFFLPTLKLIFSNKV